MTDDDSGVRRYSDLTLLTRDPEHRDQLIAQLGEWGYPVEQLD